MGIFLFSNWGKVVIIDKAESSYTIEGSRKVTVKREERKEEAKVEKDEGEMK